MPASRRPRQDRRSAQSVWKLQDAKAHFSQVVREAQDHGPQRITVHGKDAVVVLSAADYHRLNPAPKKPSLHELLSRSPLSDLDIDLEFEPTRTPIHDVEL